MRVVFFGTPEFAVPSLEALLGEGFDVAAVVTRPDKPQGRSRSQLVASPVKVAAQAEGVPILEPARPATPEFYREIAALDADIGVVVAYGHILKPELLAIPKQGMVNVHPSLLPELRGAAPVEWAIVSGLEKTGVTIMRMTVGLDSGPILHQLPHTIEPGTTGGDLSLHLSEMGALALVETLGLLQEGLLKPVPQDDARASYAPKLTRELARIRWDRGAAEIERLILGLDPKPGAWAQLDGTEVKLFGARTADDHGPAGEVRITDDGLLILAADGAVLVDEVQPAGKERMGAADWIRGRGVRTGQRFT